MLKVFVLHISAKKEKILISGTNIHLLKCFLVQTSYIPPLFFDTHSLNSEVSGKGERADNNTICLSAETRLSKRPPNSSLVCVCTHRDICM